MEVKLKTKPQHDTCQPFPVTESTLMQLLLEPQFPRKRFPQMLTIHHKAFYLQIQQHKQQHPDLANSIFSYFVPSFCAVHTLSAAVPLKRRRRILHPCLQKVLHSFVNATAKNLGIGNHPFHFYTRRRK